MSKNTILQLVQNIERARSALLTLLNGVTPEDMAEPIGKGRWSPTQYLEHLVRAEETTLWRMFKAVDDWRRRGEALASPTPGATIEEIVERTWREREEAPPLSVPQLGEPGSYWTARMQRNEALVRSFAELVQHDELDTLAYDHPISGPLTIRQGLQFVGFHMDRHRLQLEAARPGGSEPPQP